MTVVDKRFVSFANTAGAGITPYTLSLTRPGGSEVSRRAMKVFQDGQFQSLETDLLDDRLRCALGKCSETMWGDA